VFNKDKMIQWNNGNIEKKENGERKSKQASVVMIDHDKFHKIKHHIKEKLKF
jgi:hypothetical protein